MRIKLGKRSIFNCLMIGLLMVSVSSALAKWVYIPAIRATPDGNFHEDDRAGGAGRY